MACTCGHSLVLQVRSNNIVSMVSRSSLSSSTLRVHQSVKLDVRVAGSQLFGRRDSTLLELGARRYSASKLRAIRISGRRVSLQATCSAVTGEDESADSAQSYPLRTTVPDESTPQVTDGVFKRVQPYLKLARLDKPLLMAPRLLIIWPFYWGAALAAENGTLPDLRTLTLLTAAAAILYHAGCTVNDLWDKDLDGKVERSKHRPLVTGEVTPFQGWVFFGAQTLLYTVVLSQMEVFSVSRQYQVQVATQLILTFLYPLSKRWTYWTPAVLGLAINGGVFLGWAAVRGSMDLGLLPALLFFGACCWTLLWETIYAHQDINDDVNAGIKSLPLLLGDGAKLALSGFGTAMVASLSIAGQIAALGWPFYVGVAIAAAHVGWQIATVDLKNPADCWAKFCSNTWVGVFVFGGIACAKLLT